jgi:hypothetical protein
MTSLYLWSEILSSLRPGCFSRRPWPRPPLALGSSAVATQLLEARDGAVGVNGVEALVAQDTLAVAEPELDDESLEGTASAERVAGGDRTAATGERSPL